MLQNATQNLPAFTPNFSLLNNSAAGGTQPIGQSVGFGQPMAQSVTSNVGINQPVIPPVISNVGLNQPIGLSVTSTVGFNQPAGQKQPLVSNVGYSQPVMGHPAAQGINYNPQVNNSVFDQSSKQGQCNRYTPQPLL